MSCTVKRLREILDEMEKKWTKTDLEHLGAFEDSGIYILTNDGVDKVLEPNYYAEFGVMFIGEYDNLEKKDVKQREAQTDPDLDSSCGE